MAETIHVKTIDGCDPFLLVFALAVVRQLMVTFVHADLWGSCDCFRGESVQKFGRMFKRATGTPECLAQAAVRSGQRWLCARENPLGMETA